MVTAGIFMVARMSPLFELSDAALSVVLVIGAITALFMSIVAITQFDIKRVVAYSTLSQLGYMTMALGASAYPIAIFHLMTHAFFKAVLFLGAGSVIIAMHHEQDMRRMGGLKKYMPITYWTVLIGALANAGFPPFAGFFSKDTIVEALHASQTPGAGFAYLAALGGIFFAGLYSMRLVFMTFHGPERMDAHTREHLHESPGVVTWPLILLAIPSLAAGWTIGKVVYGDYFGNSIQILPSHPAMATLTSEYQGIGSMMLHGITALPFLLAVAGVATAWYFYIVRPDLPRVVARKFGVVYAIIERKYGFDELYSWLFAGGARVVGNGLWKAGDERLIDGMAVNGPARFVGWFSGVSKLLQTGRVYHYAFTMIIGVFVLLTIWFARP